MSRREAMAAWLALIAPGNLLARAVVLLALILGSQLTAWLAVTSATPAGAAALLLAHGISTVAMVRRRERWSAALVCFALLATDALLCGLLVGADPRLHAPALPLAVAVLALGLETGGWWAVGLCGGVAGGGAAAARWLGVCIVLLPGYVFSFPGVLSPDVTFAGARVLHTTVVSVPTSLSVETLFAGAPAAAPAHVAYPVVLIPETFFAGAPAVDVSAHVFTVVLAVVLIALCLGMAVNLWRVRRARRAVAASVVVAGRLPRQMLGAPITQAGGRQEGGG